MDCQHEVMSIHLNSFTHILKGMFLNFYLFQSSIATNGSMLQVASVLSRCCICFTHMLQVHGLDVSSNFRQMLHSSVSCCTCFLLFKELGDVGE